MKLNQVNALVSGRKSEVEKKITEVYHLIQKDALFDGLTRTYKPKDENGDQLPAERKLVQQKVKTIIDSATSIWTELWDLVHTQDVGNQAAKADVVVNGVTVLPQVPVTTLLFLETQLTHLQTFVSKLPTPDPSEEWEYDLNTDLLKTKPTLTVRTKKVPRNHVKAEATKEHPAQVEVYQEDTQVGTWTQILYTGRIPAQKKNEVLTLVKELRDAVKLAREQANNLDQKLVKIGKNIFDFVFAPLTK